jgi:hypothetical protein
MSDLVCHDVAQRSEEWYALRLGTPTASNGYRFITPARLGLSTSDAAYSYLLDVVGERLTGVPVYTPTTMAMQWGIDHEQSAREVYQEVAGVEVGQVGFCERDGFGCSPDGFVADGGIEIKCPYTTKEHVRVVLDNAIPPNHLIQVLLTLYVTRRTWWDYVSYDPRIPDLGVALYVQRVQADDRVAKVATAAKGFCQKIEDTLTQLKGGS